MVACNNLLYYIMSLLIISPALAAKFFYYIKALSLSLIRIPLQSSKFSLEQTKLSLIVTNTIIIII